MAKNRQPIAKRCKALGISPAVMGYSKKTTIRNPGNGMRRKQSEYATQLNLNYLYLGYWVPHSAKMNYKSQYTPLELLLDGQWRRLNRALSEQEIQQLGNSLMSTLPSEWNNLIIK